MSCLISNRAPARQAVLSVTVLGALLLASTAMAQGVPAGASKEDFIAALADMEPIEFIMQSTTSPGDNSSIPVESYAAALEEWSGGKIVPNIVYGSAIISGNWSPAVADGRLTYGSVIAQYDPSNFPIGSALVDLTFLADPRPLLGNLHSWATMMEGGNQVPEAWEEQREYGVEPGYVLGGASPSGFFCREPRTTVAEFTGVQTRTGGLLHATEVAGIGASPVALPYSEIYEGLQRGIIDCALTSINVAVITGIIPIAPNHTVSTAEGFALTVVNNAYDQVLWEEVPLAARQLMYDLQTFFIEGSLRSALASTKVGLLEFQAQNGQIVELAEDATAALRATNEQMLESARSNPLFNDANAVVDTMVATADKWDVILEEMGYTAQDPGWAGFADWYEPGVIDLWPFVNRLYQEAMLPYRPTE